MLSYNYGLISFKLGRMTVTAKLWTLALVWMQELLHQLFLLLLLLCSPAMSLGFTILLRFLGMWFFLNPTIEVVTICFHGWCMLCVFLSPTFICLGHECQDLWVSVMECMCAQTRPLIWKRFWGMESETMLIPREKPLYWKVLPRGGSNHQLSDKVPNQFDEICYARGTCWSDKPDTHLILSD